MPDEENPTQEPTTEPTAQPEAGSPENEALRTQLAEATAELERVHTWRADLESRNSELQTRATELEAQATEANHAALEAHRRAVLAEHAGKVIPELVAGATPEEIDASVETAKAAYNHVAEAVRSERPSLPHVPVGASPRTETPPEELSPIQKIQSVLTRNSR